MNSTGTITEALLPILRESVPVAAIMAIVALAALNFRIKKRANEKIDRASNFGEKDNYSRSELFSKIAMGSAILLLIPYTVSVAGLFNEIANILIGLLGVIWVVSTLISILLL